MQFLFSRVEPAPLHRLYHYIVSRQFCLDLYILQKLTFDFKYWWWTIRTCHMQLCIQSCTICKLMHRDIPSYRGWHPRTRNSWASYPAAAIYNYSFLQTNYSISCAPKCTKLCSFPTKFRTKKCNNMLAYFTKLFRNHNSHNHAKQCMLCTSILHYFEQTQLISIVFNLKLTFSVTLFSKLYEMCYNFSRIFSREYRNILITVKVIVSIIFYIQNIVFLKNFMS